MKQFNRGSEAKQKQNNAVVFPQVAGAEGADKAQKTSRVRGEGSLKAHFDNFWRYRYLLENLVMRDFKLRYRRSVLGVAWSVLNPLLMCLVYWAVFSSLFASFKSDGIENFAVYLLCGQLLFSFFSESSNNSMSSMLGAAPLMKKVYIPKYIFPLEKCCFGMVNCFFSFVALMIVMLMTGNAITFAVFLAIYPLITLFFFTLGVSLALAAFTVFFRDVMHMWTVFTTALMYFSAIFYDPASMSNLPGGFSMQTLILFNPLYWYITAFRTTVMSGEVLTFSMVWVCGLCAIVSVAVGSIIFNKTQDKFVLHI